MNISRYRDLTIIADGDKKLVIACDSSGAIGPKELDVVKVDANIVGRFICRVVLLEIISVGAKPITLIDTLSVEMNPTGAEIIAGIIEEMNQIGLDPTKALNGSTEENIRVKQTGVGLTGIGEVTTLYCESFVNDLVICVGIPKVGNEVSISDPEICDLLVVQKLRELEGVHEIVPVGSKGIAYELEELLKRNKLTLEKEETNLNIEKAAGPATCVLLTANRNILMDINKISKQPVNILGSLIDRD